VKLEKFFPSTETFPPLITFNYQSLAGSWSLGRDKVRVKLFHLRRNSVTVADALCFPPPPASFNHDFCDSQTAVEGGKSFFAKEKVARNCFQLFRLGGGFFEQLKIHRKI
jgi:hypothetical protein